MADFFLNIFPTGSLSKSVTTTVWVGVLVSAWFNLRLGWVFSGIVVPGYIVPLIIVKPWAAFAIFIESVVTYLIIWNFSEYLSKFGRWTNFFGRDRFFALLLCSVLVRLLFDTIIFPHIGEYLNDQFDLTFDYKNNLYSFGLIVVALIANQFWKPGFFRSFVPLAVTIGITYLIVRYLLMGYTNFTISNLSYAYEDIAISMLASPKAYIILLTTCFIASRMNLFYSWEYSGILVPSLLALQWYHPEKVLVTFVEAFFIYYVAILILTMPFYKRKTMEGASKLLLFFNISFVYKMIVGFVIMYFWQDIKISDSYGFGYLLPTLMAIKMHQKNITAKVTMSVLAVSIIGVTLSTLIGYALTFLPDFMNIVTYLYVS